jgi:outer membrane immunogenic protein
MRVAIILSAVLGLTANALAADLDDGVLRGSSGYQPGVPVYYRWNGAYAGGQVGYSDGRFDFSGATGPQTQLLLNQNSFTNPITGKDNTSAATYGAFVGVNRQWDDVVLGAELSYSHTNLLAASSPGSFIVPLNGNTNTLIGSASADVFDYATIRGRAGYAFSRFLAYAFAGVAVARADLARSTTLFVTSPNPAPPPTTITTGPFTLTQNQQSAFLYGYTLGAGMDIVVIPGVFVRAEYEYIGFASFMSSAANMHSARVGAGVQF